MQSIRGEPAELNILDHQLARQLVESQRNNEFSESMKSRGTQNLVLSMVAGEKEGHTLHQSNRKSFLALRRWATSGIRGTKRGALIFRIKLRSCREHGHCLSERTLNGGDGVSSEL